VKRKVLIPTKLDAVAKDILTANGNYEVVQEEADILALAARHPDTYALIVRSEKVNTAVIEALQQLKVVIRAGAGYDNIDTKFARTKGIDVMNTPGANTILLAGPSGSQVGSTSLATTVEVRARPPRRLNSSGRSSDVTVPASTSTRNSVLITISPCSCSTNLNA